MSSSSAPSVAIVVPVLNDESRIARCIEGLLAQTWPEDRREIIVVDNGSTDGTREVVSSYPVRLLVEASRRTPYVARNTGIASSASDVIALIDADCVPRADWMTSALVRLEAEGADLVGGRVEFSFSARAGAGEWYDSITNLEMENNIRERGVAKTANLFFRRRVFDEIGPFPMVRSGGDVWWTGRATRTGFRMVYAPGAVVLKPARPLRQLLRKQYRVGQGQPNIWRAAGRSWGDVTKQILMGFRPPHPRSVRWAIRERGRPEMERALPAMWGVAWVCRVITNLGRVHALMRGTRGGAAGGGP